MTDRRAEDQFLYELLGAIRSLDTVGAHHDDPATVSVYTTSTRNAQGSAVYQQYSEMTTMLSTKQRVQEMVRYKGLQAQRTVDMLAERDIVLDLVLKKRAMWVISTICKKQAILPTSLVIADTIRAISSNPNSTGGFADVYRGRLGTLEVAVKRPRLYAQKPGNRDNMRKAVCKEASIWRSIRHPNVLEFIGVSQTVFPDEICLVSPWLANGDVASYLKHYKRANRVKILRDIAAGLDGLHTLNIIHGDIKSSNILVNHNGTAQLVDFGFASIAIEGGLDISTTLREGGSTRWLAPELIQGAKISPQSDVYAVGMVAWELFSGTLPFPEVRGLHADAVIINKVTNHERPARPEGAEQLGLSDFLWAGIMRCWHPNPTMRLTAPAFVSGVKRVLRTFQGGQMGVRTIRPSKDEKGDDDTVPDGLFPEDEE